MNITFEFQPQAIRPQISVEQNNLSRRSGCSRVVSAVVQFFKDLIRKIIDLIKTFFRAIKACCCPRSSSSLRVTTERPPTRTASPQTEEPLASSVTERRSNWARAATPQVQQPRAQQPQPALTLLPAQYPATLPERVALYSNLPNESLPLFKKLIEIHKLYLQMKDRQNPPPAGRDGALRTFEDNLASFDPEVFLQLAELCARAMIFTDKPIVVGRIVPDYQTVPEFLKFNEVQQNAWGRNVVREIPLNVKIPQLKNLFASLSNEDKMVILDHFGCDATALPLSAAGQANGRALWAGLRQIGYNTTQSNQYYDNFCAQLLRSP